MDAKQALADLTEISSQIESAVLVTKDGQVLASTFPEEARGKEVAELALELLAAAEEARGSAQLVQVEGATGQGSVFVVRDDENVAAAVTTPRPTVGLVFYDLKTCLRLVEPAPKPKGKATKPRSPRKKKEEGKADGS